MFQCSICDKWTSDKIRIPTTEERRREFAERFGLNEELSSAFINLPKERYLCSDHFDTDDWLLDGKGLITKIKRTALPKKNFQHLPTKATTTTSTTTPTTTTPITTTPTTTTPSRTTSATTPTTTTSTTPSRTTSATTPTTTTSTTATPTTATTAVTGNDLPFNGFGSSYNANLFGNGRGGYGSLFGNSRLGLNNSEYNNQFGNIQGSSENILKFESSSTKNFIQPSTPKQIMPPSTEIPTSSKQIIPPSTEIPNSTKQIIPPSTEFKFTQDDNDYEEYDFDNFETYDDSQNDSTTEIKLKRTYATREKTSDEEIISSPPKKKFYNMEEDCEEECDERVQYVMISIDRLLDIFNTCYICKEILGKGKKEFRLMGTAGSIKYYCSGCDKRMVFATQDTIPGTKIYKGNALLSSAAQITPVSYPTLKLLFNLSRINIFANDRYKNTAKNVVWPVVNEIYQDEHRQMLEMLKKRKEKNESPVNIAVDGQYDSPGYCAMMCKVTAIDSESGYVVGLKTLQRKETENKSARMEIEGVRRFMDEMKENNIEVDCITSDRNSGVTKMMESDYKKTKHKRDPWHMVKGITKDLKNEAKKKTKFPNLELFVHPIKNHMWFSIIKSKGDGILCREILVSSLFHLLGIHSWKKGNICKQLQTTMSKLVGTNKTRKQLFRQMNPSKCSKFFQELKFEQITHCCHDEIDPKDDDTGYLDPVSKEYFYILLKLTADKFLKDVIHLSPDLATSKVENFNSIATGIYTPKRTYFPYDSYKMRSYLAVLHYNNNERSEKEGNRTVLRTLTYPSKALGGELVRKKVKSKAPIKYKHNIIERCLEVFEKGVVVSGNVVESNLNEQFEEVDESDESISLSDVSEMELAESNDESHYGIDESETELADSNDESELEETKLEQDQIKKETTENVKSKNTVVTTSVSEEIIIEKDIQNEIKFFFKPPTDIFFKEACKLLKLDDENTVMSPLRKMQHVKKISSVFKRHNVKPDGNCGYRALSYLLFNTEEFHWLIRRLVTSWRCQNKEEEAMKNWEIIKDQIEERSTLNEPHLWMNDRDMIAFAKIFFVNLLNYTHQGVSTPRWRCYSPGRVSNSSQKYQYPCICIFLEGVHFEAIVSVDGFE